jgi:beta-N-acetylhexosaminidase
LLGGKQLMGSHLNLELTVEDIRRVHRFLVAAVRNQEISEQRIDASVTRILALKSKYGLFDRIYPTEKEIALHVNTSEHHQLAKLIANLSVNKVKSALPEKFLFKDKKIAILAPLVVNGTVKNSSLLQLGKERVFFAFNTQNPTEEEIKNGVALVKNADVAVVFSYNAWQFPHQKAFLQSLLEVKKPTIVISLRDSQDMCLFPQASVLIASFSPTAYSLEAAIRQIVVK